MNSFIKSSAIIFFVASMAFRGVLSSAINPVNIDIAKGQTAPDTPNVDVESSQTPADVEDKVTPVEEAVADELPPFIPVKPPFSDVTMEDVIANASEDASRSIKEMVSKLDDVMGAQTKCQKDRDTFFNPNDPVIEPCFDITRGQSVLTQICSKITNLESRVGRIRYQDPVAREVSSDQHENELQKLREEIDRLKRSSAFSASRNFVINGGATKQKLADLSSNVNTDLSFDAISGLYKVPFDGNYHFSLSLLKTEDGTNVEACLVVDGVPMATASGKQQQSSTDLVVALTEGQTVWTDVTYGDRDPADPEYNVTFTFSGFLLH